MRVGSPAGRTNTLLQGPQALSTAPTMRVGSPPRRKAMIIVDQRWVFARLLGNLTKLFPPVQFPTQDQLQALEPEALENF